ncbi:hypothetical protein T552_01718 [Pneumocystis carinii B80]|uniref:Synaptobrevin homolog YKT6 n=1 Tax=Pneumocystis carinii (strain B80) TaxID=1408658 RepID=A0A0W4ZJA6_PNEC8|nr:hypothetical protein T552_01718 [Pneumocystis carinii B80]KTW28457.1 hypothetical protein T552_01718 [Pneumocystis carinii B80]
MSIFYVGIAREREILAEYVVDGIEIKALVCLVLEKIRSNEETRLTYLYKSYMIHYICTPIVPMGNLTYLCITSDEIGRRVPFALLGEIKQYFGSNFSMCDIFELPLSSFSFVNEEISKKVDAIMNGEDGVIMVDMARVVHKEIEQVKSAMMENIERVLERGERIELLVDRTQNMNETAFSFSKRSTYLRRRILWESIKTTVILSLVVLFLLYLLIGFGCGFPVWQNCR